MANTTRRTTAARADDAAGAGGPGSAALGLTAAEARDRRQRGLGNTAPPTATRSYRQIARQNAFTFINSVLYVTGLALVAIGLWGDALVTVGLVLFNVAIAVTQEVRAKRTLDRITLLTRPRVGVVRDGRTEQVDAAELVFGDVVALKPGDQAVTDGVLLPGGQLEMDESLLTGESEPVPKRPGDRVFSGSFCVSGSGTYETDTVGADSEANRMTAGARTFRQEKTPLQRDLDLIIRGMVVLVVLIGGPVVIDLTVRVLDVAHRLANESLSNALDDAYHGFSARETVRAAAVVVAIVPQGLALMIVVTYALAAVRLIGKGALVQQTNAVESLSHVDVLCLDKTGTLTTNNLLLAGLHPLEASEAELAALLGEMAANTTGRNRTTAALAAALPGRPREIDDEVPFSSARRWSAVAFRDGDHRGPLVLGAADALDRVLPPGDERDAVIARWTAGGRRVLVLAAGPQGARLRDAAGAPALPETMTPLGLVAFADELRPDARETLERFAVLGVQPKVISGDDARTVAALAIQAGFPESVRVVSGADLEELADDTFAEAIDAGTIFGRVTPRQKERFVRALRERGRYVAMIGDGVNDILAMKQANLAIAVRSGTPATRGVADLVLLDDSFAALPAAFAEGQRILGGMRDVVGLFLARSLAVTAVILGAVLAEAPFPLTPKHNAVLAFFALGVPTLALAAWAAPARSGVRLLRAIAPVTGPAVLTIAPVGLIVYLSWWRVTDDIASSRAALTVTLVGCGLLLILFVRPPSRFWDTGRASAEDVRPAAVAAVLGGVFLIALQIERFRASFELAPLSVVNVGTIAAVLAIWVLVIRQVWQRMWMERLFGLSEGAGNRRPAA